MRILIATGLYPPDIGGPATYTKFLERHLPKHGVELKVVAFTHVRQYPKVIRHVLYLLRLAREARNADIIYALDTISVGVPALIISKLFGKKLYLRVPGDYAWEQGQQRFGVTDTLDTYLVKGTKSFPVRVLAFLQSRVARHATRVVVPSEYMKTVAAAWGVRPQNVVRIYSALNPIVVDGTKESLRAKYGYTDFTLITAARLTPWKGIDALIDATVALRAHGHAVSLEVVGSGEQQRHLESYIAEKNAQGFIHLRGQVDKGELAERIKAADVFLLNTSYEGLSHQLLEVMEIGVPIITTPVGGNVELISHEQEGLVVPWNDREKIAEAVLRIHKGDIVSTITQNARQKVSLFREDVVIPEIVALFS